MADETTPIIETPSGPSSSPTENPPQTTVTFASEAYAPNSQSAWGAVRSGFDRSFVAGMLGALDINVATMRSLRKRG
jgi:hypothetical protein